MNRRVLNIVLILVLVYCFFVWRGLQKKFRLPQINSIMASIGLKTGTGTDSFELFQIGLGIKSI
jgi:hypothetical protein